MDRNKLEVMAFVTAAMAICAGALAYGTDRGLSLPVSGAWLRPYSSQHSSLREHVLTLPPCTTQWAFEEAVYSGRTYELAICRGYSGPSVVDRQPAPVTLILTGSYSRVVSVAMVARLSSIGEVRGTKMYADCPTVVAGNELSTCDSGAYYMLYNQDRIRDMAVILLTESRMHINPSWSMDHMHVRFME